MFVIVEALAEPAAIATAAATANIFVFIIVSLPPPLIRNPESDGHH
ncbi:MAG TPA: hypothetical protein VFK60_00530 [Casimicrobiaceae bacterium]|nr:hypothetical protein [Casimicrobiaceae bacterium]